MGEYVKIGNRVVWHETPSTAIEYASTVRPRPIDVRVAAPRTARPTIAELQRRLDATVGALLEHEARATAREFARINNGPVISVAEAKRRREWEAKGNSVCNRLPFGATRLK